MMRGTFANVKLANQLVVFTSILSMFTLVLVISVVKGLGLL